jgi:predicted methyltransferase
MRKVVELAGWKVEAQTGILRDPWDVSWKGRAGIRGRASALRAVRKV